MCVLIPMWYVSNRINQVFRKIGLSVACFKQIFIRKILTKIIFMYEHASVGEENDFKINLKILTISLKG